MPLPIIRSKETSEFPILGDLGFVLLAATGVLLWARTVHLPPILIYRGAGEPLRHGRSTMEENRKRRADLFDAARERLARYRERGAAYEEWLVEQEIRRSAAEMEKYDEADQARIAEENAFLRSEVALMLARGWTVEELREIGIPRELLGSLGLLDTTVDVDR